MSSFAGATFCCLMMVVILPRCSVDSLAEPAAAPCPVVLDLAAPCAVLSLLLGFTVASVALLSDGALASDELLTSGVLASDELFTPLCSAALSAPLSMAPLS